MAKKKIGDYISEWMAEFGPENGYELSRCEFVKEAGTWYRRVYVDRLTEEGYGWMTSDDCEIVSRYLSDRLDEADPIPDSYVLEVGSAGAERELKRPSDFEQFLGSEVEVRLYQPMDGAKAFVGKLKGYDSGDVTIETGGSDIRFDKSRVALVKLHISI